jgi:hypothetical protein
MPRRGKTIKREMLPDARYGQRDCDATGKQDDDAWEEEHRPRRSSTVRSRWQRERLKKTPMEAMDGALRNADQVIEVKPRRVGGATYQVCR